MFRLSSTEFPNQILRQIGKGAYYIQTEITTLCHLKILKMYADNCEGLNSEEQLEQGHSAANLSKE